MKINDSTGKLSPAALNDREQPTAPAIAGSATAAARANEQVRLSAPARALMACSAQPPTNTGRLAAIRQQIAEGSYRIDPAKIADSLISAARELFSRRH